MISPGRRPTELQRVGFTLVELLIVVAIIALLASIAVPNFIEAQARAKVARAASDLRTISTGLEAYHVDWNRYPPTPFESLPDRGQRLKRLTTPVAYLSSMPGEVFSEQDNVEPYPYWSDLLNNDMKFSPIYFFLVDEKNRRGRWALFSRSPDMDYEAAPEEGGGGFLVHYDPTNGTVSNGDVMLFGP